jgi:hypothetical protein
MTASSDLVDPRPPPEACPNCGTSRLGAYCHVCGQRYADARLTVALIWGWFVNDVFDLDHGLLLTVRELFTRPGEMIRCYVAGQRRRYTNPATYLFLTVGLSLVVWSLLADPIAADMKALYLKTAHAMSGLSEAQRLRWVELQVGLIPYTAQIALVMCLLFVVLLRVLLRKSGYTFAEILVFGLFTTGQIFLTHSVLTGVILLFSHSYWAHTAMTMALYPVIYVQAARGFFRQRGTTARVLLALAVSFMAYSLLQSMVVRAVVLLTA